MKNKSGWKGESRRHSLARKGIKTATDQRSCPQHFSMGKSKEVPESYRFIDRESYISNTERGYFTIRTSGKTIESPCDPITNAPLTAEELMALDPETLISAKQYGGRRGGCNRRTMKVGNLILPDDPMLLQLDIGTEVEKEHIHGEAPLYSENWKKARQIAIDHLNENNDYYTVLLKAFPDEHPELIRKLQSKGLVGVAPLFGAFATVVFVKEYDRKVLNKGEVNE